MLRSDVILEHDVLAELASDSLCAFVTISVAVRSGIVTLSGTVANLSLKEAARRAAKRVFGVDGVNECLEIASPATPQQTNPASVIGSDATL